MTARFLFVHGWALDASLWDGVRAALGAHSGTARELGYFSAVSDPGFVEGPVIAVGHSLGTMQLLDQPPAGLVGLVAINGFTRFAASADHPEGVPVRLLHRMMQRLEQDVDATVRAFRARCGIDEPPPGRCVLPVLKQGLEQLRDGDARSRIRTLRCPVLALAGNRDAIAPPELSRACFDDLRWVEEGGHLLPLTHPALCARLLRGFAGRIEC